MAALPYMPLYVADYLADAAHLSTMQHGAYLLLIMTYWQRGEPLPDCDRKLARIARLTNEEWAEIREDIAEFFLIEDGLWRHKRIDQELAGVREKTEKAKRAGQASAKAKANKRSTDAQRPLNGCSVGRQQLLNSAETNAGAEAGHDTYTGKDQGASAAEKGNLGNKIADFQRTFSECSTDVQQMLNGCLTDVEQTSNHTDTDTDTDTDLCFSLRSKHKNISLSLARARDLEKEGVARPLPDDWDVDPETMAEVIAMGLDPGTVKAEAEKFCLHHRSTGAVRANWAEAYKLWCARAIEHKGRVVRPVRYAKAQAAAAKKLEREEPFFRALKKRLSKTGPEAFTAWFLGARLEREPPNSAVLWMPSQFASNHVRDHFGDEIKRTAHEVGIDWIRIDAVPEREAAI